MKDNADIKHPVFRECLKKYSAMGLEISSLSDVPSGTGLGSSSTFTVGLIGALRSKNNMTLSEEILAHEACDIEINRLHEPIGKQDQYAAAFGGINFIEFAKDDSVSVEPLRISDKDKNEINDSLMMFYLGGTRDASSILKKQTANIESGSVEKRQIKMCRMTEDLRCELEAGNIDIVGKVLDEAWKIKKELASNISNDFIDSVYSRALSAGAVGGKLLGAGGNGFMLFSVPTKNQKSVMDALGDLRYMPMRFESEGCKVISNDVR